MTTSTDGVDWMTGLDDMVDRIACRFDLKVHHRLAADQNLTKSLPLPKNKATHKAP